MMRATTAERSPSSWFEGLWGGVICSTPMYTFHQTILIFPLIYFREYCPQRGETSAAKTSADRDEALFAV